MPAESDSSRPRSPAALQAPGEATSQSLQWLTVDVVDDAGDWSAFEPVVARVEQAAMALAASPHFAGYGKAEAVVALSNDANVQSLNATYRDKDKPTNVLSFPSGAPARGGIIALGDIVLAVETISREAAEQGIPPEQHLQHLVVHGLLHLLGLDHETDEEAAEMEALEVDILTSLGIPNPYTETAS